MTLWLRDLGTTSLSHLNAIIVHFTGSLTRSQTWTYPCTWTSSTTFEG